MSNNLVPHKPIIPWTKSAGLGGIDIDYNRCDSCGKTTGDAIHRLEFRNKPISYQLFLEQQ